MSQGDKALEEEKVEKRKALSSFTHHNQSTNPDIKINTNLFRPNQSSDDFKEIVQTHYFVDKSLFIAEVLGGGNSYLITRPRRWGKTTNLKMLNTFLEVHDQRLQGMPPSKTYFAGGDFEGTRYRTLKISTALSPEGRSFMDDFQAKHPVIFINLKDVTADLNSPNPVEGVENSLKGVVKDLYRKKYYLLDWLKENRPVYKSENFEKVLDGDVDLKWSLKNLVSLLSDCHGKQVFILVDEYDRCTNYIFQVRASAKTEDDRDWIQKQLGSIAFTITEFLGPVCKGNDDVKQAILTGIFDTLYRESDSGLNNLTQVGIEHPLFSKSFGLTEEEIRNDILKPLFNGKSNQPGIEDMLMEIINKHFNGYEDKKICNIFSVMCFIHDLISHQKLTKQLPRNYWNESGGSDILQNLKSIHLRDEIFEKLVLLTGRNDVEFDEEGLRQFGLIPTFTSAENKISERGLIYVLLNSGYITRAQKGFSLFRIPNQEVLEFFGDLVLSHWVHKTGGTSYFDMKLFKEAYIDIAESLKETGEFQIQLNKILQRLEDGTKTEEYFGSLIGGGIILFNIYLPKKATHNIGGKIGHIFYPLQGSFPVIIHEYKVAHNLRDVQSVMEETKWQLFIKNYMADPYQRSQTLHAVETRFIVFCFEESQGKWSAQIGFLKFNLSQVKTIVEFFSSSDEIAVMRTKFKNGRNFDQEKSELLRKYEAKNLEDLLGKLSTVENPSQDCTSMALLIENPQQIPPSTVMSIEENPSQNQTTTMLTEDELKEEIMTLLHTILQKVSVATLEEIMSRICHDKTRIIAENNPENFKKLFTDVKGVGDARTKSLLNSFPQIKEILKKCSE